MELPKWKGKKKELWQLICGNGIAEMGGKKLWQLIVFFRIAEMGGKEKNYGNGVAKNWRRERERERE